MERIVHHTTDLPVRYVVLNTFYLRLHGVGHTVKNNSEEDGEPVAATWATLSD